MSVIHIAPDIGYLFNSSEKTLCGQTVAKVFKKGEFVGLKGNLNSDCSVCPICQSKAEGK